MYRNTKSQVRINSTFSDEFLVKVGLHQGSVLSPLLFIIVLEALSREIRSGCPEELLYADDLALVSETLAELIEKLESWKSAMESKGLRVNLKKTKVMISGSEVGKNRDEGRYPCAVCRKGVGNNSIVSFASFGYINVVVVLKVGLKQTRSLDVSAVHKESL